MTAVSLVNVLRLLTTRVPGANINEVPNSAVGQKNRGILRRRPQLELGCGPGRAKCARARPSFDLRKPTKPIYSPVAWSTARKKIHALFCPVPPRQPKTPNPRKNPEYTRPKKIYDHHNRNCKKSTASPQKKKSIVHQRAQGTCFSAGVIEAPREHFTVCTQFPRGGVWLFEKAGFRVLLHITQPAVDIFPDSPTERFPLPPLDPPPPPFFCIPTIPAPSTYTPPPQPKPIFFSSADYGIGPLFGGVWRMKFLFFEKLGCISVRHPRMNSTDFLFPPPSTSHFFQLINASTASFASAKFSA